MKIYTRLYQAYGPRHWWPGETPFEVMVGAILTQNTSWKNVEMAIRKLKENRVLNPDGIYRLKEEPLGLLIRASGFYRIKAKRLKTFVSFLFDEYEGDIHKMKRGRVSNLREKLLGIHGIGPETADSILLYGLQKPIFVVDAYTKKVLSRHGIVSEKASYETIQNLFMEHLPHEEKLFNEYHALLVHLGKNVCKKRPECNKCPIKDVRCEVLGARRKTFGKNLLRLTTCD